MSDGCGTKTGASGIYKQSRSLFRATTSYLSLDKIADMTNYFRLEKLRNCRRLAFREVWVRAAR